MLHAEEAADFSRLSLTLDSIEKDLKLLKEEGADWCSDVTSTDKKLEDDYQIIVRREPVPGTTPYRAQPRTGHNPVPGTTPYWAQPRTGHNPVPGTVSSAFQSVSQVSGFCK